MLCTHPVIPVSFAGTIQLAHNVFHFGSGQAAHLKAAIGRGPLLVGQNLANLVCLQVFWLLLVGGWPSVLRMQPRNEFRLDNFLLVLGFSGWFSC